MSKFFLILSLTLGAVFLVGGFLLIQAYGKARENVGYESCMASVADRTLAQASEDSKALDHISVSVERLDDPALDAALADLGIVRKDSDR